MPKATSLGRLILKVYPQQDFDDKNYSFARVTIDKSFVEDALRTISTFRKVEKTHPKLEELAFYSPDVDLIGYFDPGEVYGGPWADEFEVSEYSLEPSSFVPITHDVSRIGSSQARVSSRGVYWRTTAKYGNTTLETSTIMTEDLLKWADALGARRPRGKSAL